MPSTVLVLQRNKWVSHRRKSVKRTVVYAVGGNAIQPPGGTDNDASLILAKVMSDIVDLLEMGWSVVLTHGNGPQVGHLMAMDSDLTQPLDAWVAATQGMIGHDLSLHLQGILERRKRPERTVVIMTHVEVDPDDPGFARPVKPVGPVLDANTVMTADWDIAETVHGPRRVVASPSPIHIIEVDVIRHLVELRAVVICGGGGGIPVVRATDHLVGAPAVIDKDLLSCRLALDLGADALIISTDADAIYSDFGTSSARAHRRLSTDDVTRLSKDGQFPAGSMLPKVNALKSFAEQRTGARALLCRPGDVLEALRGDAGTTIESAQPVDGESHS